LTPSSSPRVLVVGYSPRIKGGVTGVTATLIDSVDGIELYPIMFVYFPAWKSACLTLWSLLKLPLKILRYHADIVHVIVGSKGDVVRTLPAILMGRLMRRKVIIQFHTSVPIIFPASRGLLARLVRRIWRRVTALFFLSPALSAEFDSIFSSGPRRFVIPNALRAGWLEIPTTPLEERDKDVVFLGRWSQEKGAHDLVEIFSNGLEIDRSDKPLVCHIYSNDRPAQNVPYTQFHGWLSEDDVRDVLCGARILILPSYMEAYPTVLLEAAACGTPFVSTSIGGITDIARESEAGLICAPGDIRGLRASLRSLAADPRLWSRLSAKGESWAQKQSASRIARLWEDAYLDVMNIS
jgi:glycosyltransferase involved in cell wall biosynthesis